MARLVAVDADVIIDYFQGVEPGASAVGRLLDGGRLGLAASTVFELACGVATARQRADLELLIRAAEILELDTAGALEAGRIYRQLKAAGALIGRLDILLAGICLSRSTPVLTRNADHLGRVAGLTVMTPDG